jgi:FkbM family methyltransferase
MAITAPRVLMRNAWARKRARDLWTACYQLMRGKRFVARRMGYRLLFDADSVIDKYLLAYGVYEEKQQRLLFDAARAAVKPGEPAVFLDVGAHAGFYALAALSSGLFGRIVAVEADPRNAHQLYANLFLNGLSDRIAVVEAAASAEPGEVTFNVAPSRNRSVSRILADGETSAGTAHTVSAVRLDDVEPLRGGLIVAKIDVEGHEADVLKGMTRLLAENRCILQVEVFGPALAAFTGTMTGLGYSKFAEVDNDRFFRNVQSVEAVS